MTRLNSQLHKLIFASAIHVSLAVCADENPELETLASNGYQLHIHSQLKPIEINQIHSWILELSNDSGVISGAEIVVQGGMPEHNHGLPTEPQMTGEVSPGTYLVEGIRFHMPGAWRVRFLIRVNGKETQAFLDFQL